MICPICSHRSLARIHARVGDYEHGLDVSVDFNQCLACKLVFQSPAPDPAALQAAYPPDYRPHASAASTKNGIARALGWLKSLQARSMVKTLSPHLPAGRDAPVLEIGCGSGQLMLALASSGYRSLYAVDQAASMASAFERTGIRFEASNPELDGRLPFDRQFEVILMNYVIEHFSDPLHILELCRKRLQDGGRLVIVTPNPRSWSHRLFGKYWSGLHSPRHVCLFEEESFRRAAEKSGLSIARLGQLMDVPSWGISFQNIVQSFGTARPRAGTAWYTLLSLPLWAPVAALERLFGRSGTLLGVLEKRGSDFSARS